MALADLMNVRKLEADSIAKKNLRDKEFFSMSNSLGITDTFSNYLKTNKDGTASGMQALLEKTSDGKFVHGDMAANLLNEIDILKLYKDENNKEIKEGKVAGINANPDGSYSLMIDTPQGFFPKTFGFSNREDDEVIKLSKKEVEHFLNLGIAKKRGRAFPESRQGDGFSQLITDSLDPLAADVKAGKVEIEDAALFAQNALQQIMQGTDPADIESTNNTPLDTDPKTTVNTAGEGSDLLGARQLAKEESQFGDQQDPSGEFSYLEKDEYNRIFEDKENDNSKYYEFQKMLHQRLISEKLDAERNPNKESKFFKDPTSFKAPRQFYREVKNIFKNDPEALKKFKDVEDMFKSKQRNIKTIDEAIAFAEEQMDVAVNTQRQESSEAKTSAELPARNRVKFLQDQLQNNSALDTSTRQEYTTELESTLAKLDGRTPSTEPLPTAEELEIPPVPADLEGQQKWAQENEAKIRQLGQDKVKEVQAILNRFDIQKLADLKKLEGQLDIGQRQALAATLAFTTSQNDPTKMINLYKTYENQIQTGNASTTPTQRAQLDINYEELRLKSLKYSDELAGDLKDITTEATDILYPQFKEGGSRRGIDATKISGSSEKAANTRQRIKNLLGEFTRNRAYAVTGTDVKFRDDNTRETVKNVYGQIVTKFVEENGSQWGLDWLADIIRSNDPQAIGAALDRMKARIEVRNGRRYVAEIYFTDAAGRETEGNMTQSQITQLFGTPGSKERAVLMSFLTEA